MPDLPEVLEGIETRDVKTSRITLHVHLSKKQTGFPVLFIHGNFSTATYFEELIVSLPENLFGLAPDLRGYGLTEDRIVDATRGVRDWSDDLAALLEALDIKKTHVVGWSMGGGVAMQLLIDYPERIKTLTMINPISPYGFGGTKDEKGTICYEDCAGSGAGTVNPDFVKKIKEHDTGELDPNSPRNVMNNFYFKPPFRAQRENDFVLASLLQKTGEQRYPGDFVSSPNWPFVAPGKFGPVNAMSPKYFNASGIADVSPKPPIMWIRGSHDSIVSDASFFDIGNLGKLGFVPNYPGESVYPPQPMIKQTMAVLETYKEKGGVYHEVVIQDTAHSPHIEKKDEFIKTFLEFLNSNA